MPPRRVLHRIREADQQYVTSFRFQTNTGESIVISDQELMRLWNAEQVRNEEQEQFDRAEKDRKLRDGDAIDGVDDSPFFPLYALGKILILFARVKPKDREALFHRVQTLLAVYGVKVE